jgi:hypothetical protein
MALLFINRQWIKNNTLAAVAIGIASVLVMGYLVRTFLFKK